MEIYIKYLLFPYFLFYLVFKHNFIGCFDFTRIAASNAASEQVMTSLIRSHIEYLIQTYYILVLIM